MPFLGGALLLRKSGVGATTLSNEKVVWTSGEIIYEGKTAHLTTVPHTAQEF